ncbi:SLAM family member 8-like isoform X2 [Hemibagrus wyckioides]|uniref:SLAM family member 8-like isoform X2 n=1 Tax=Hemibagrus wyckioides TaxID=337641 RepID=UPI00266B695F|nr:SLAM family member 8-like isoform X2 [Hemibagrus wyckioides]
MWNFHGYRVSVFGALMFGILQGLCAVSADTETEKVLKVGSSLDLTVRYPKNSVLFVRWNLNGTQFADYTPSRNYTFRGTQFSGRLRGVRDLIGVTLQDLQTEDSGTFSIVAAGSVTQYPTQTIKVYIQNPIGAVQIEKTQRWLLPTNSCEVDVKCAALGAENVSYRWSGYKNENGAQLQFSLSPAEGAVTLNCTAANYVSSSSATETLSCSTEQPETDETDETDVTLIYVWIAVAGGVAFILLIAVTVSLICWKKSQKDGSAAPADGNTLYAEVTLGAFTKKDKRSDSVANGMTLYETVDDVRNDMEKTAQTIYAKVTLPQHTKASATSSSPYQQVL